MHSESLGTVALDRGSDTLDKIAVGNLSYAEFRHAFGLRAEHVQVVKEEADRYVLRSVPEQGTAGRAAGEMLYYVEKGTYVLLGVDFLQARALIKELRVEAKEHVDGRWVIRRARVNDFVDGSRTTFDTEYARFNRGVDARLLIPPD
jgi:hypothetical protein